MVFNCFPTCRDFKYRCLNIRHLLFHEANRRHSVGAKPPPFVVSVLARGKRELRSFQSLRYLHTILIVAVYSKADAICESACRPHVDQTRKNGIIAKSPPSTNMQSWPEVHLFFCRICRNRRVTRTWFAATRSWNFAKYLYAASGDGIPPFSGTAIGSLYGRIALQAPNFLP